MMFYLRAPAPHFSPSRGAGILLPALFLLVAFVTPAGGESAGAAGGETVLGLSFRGAHRAYPAGTLESPWIINDIISRQEVVIYYNRDRALARAYVRMVLGEPILFADRPRDTIGEDLTTMTRWDLGSGEAVSGNLTGMQLVPLTLAETTHDEWSRLHPDSTFFPNEP